MTNGNEIRYLTVSDIEDIIDLLRSQKEEYTEDIPPFKTCDISKLESCLAQCSFAPFGVPLYSTLKEKAAWLLYGLIKNHPLLNGNKRTAVFAYMIFLNYNIDDFYITQNEGKVLLDLATEISSSDPKEKDNMLKKIGYFFEYQMQEISDQDDYESENWETLA